MISVVMGVRGRPNATRRTLQSYCRFTHPDWELLYIDVLHGGADTHCIYEEFKDKLPIRYLSLREDMKHYIPNETTWTPATTWNYGIGQSVGDFVVTCSADIIPSCPDMLEEFLTQYQNNRISVLTWFLSKDMTLKLDECIDHPEILEELPYFFDQQIDGDTNRNRHLAGLTTYITGQPKEMWEYMGLFRTELSHLVNDQDMMLRDVAVGRGVDTLAGCVGYHQAHHIELDIPCGANVMSPGWQYENENQARLLEPAPRDRS